MALEIFDAHLHLFTRAFFEALAAQSPLPGTPAERLARAATRAKAEVPPADLAAHVVRWVDELDRHGVARAVAFASVPEEADAVAEAARLAKGRLVPVAVVNPKAPGAPERVRGLLATKGYRGILLFPALHHYRFSGPELAAVLPVVAEHGAVVYAQCGMLKVPLRDVFGLPRAYDVTWANPLDLVPAANAHPRVRFVVPHFGAGLFRETLIAGSQCDNVVVDTSSSNAWTAVEPAGTTLEAVFRRALGVFGPERVLFGTDSGTFPRGWRRDVLTAQREALDAAGVRGTDVARIVAGNAARLFP
jgi:predicted TIM-barrel fold metal-dependent hydrolase